MKPLQLAVQPLEAKLLMEQGFEPQLDLWEVPLLGTCRFGRSVGHQIPTVARQGMVPLPHLRLGTRLRHIALPIFHQASLCHHPGYRHDQWYTKVPTRAGVRVDRGGKKLGYTISYCSPPFASSVCLLFIPS
jgi:hypothetical protein